MRILAPQSEGATAIVGIGDLADTGQKRISIAEEPHAGIATTPTERSAALKTKGHRLDRSAEPLVRREIKRPPTGSHENGQRQQRVIAFGGVAVTKWACAVITAPGTV